MTAIAHFNLGEKWNVVATFKVNDVLTNPGAVSGTLLKPSGAMVVIPSLDARIVNTSLGVWTFSDTAVEIGPHYLEVVGTDPAAGLERFSFVIDPRWPKDLLATYALTSIENVELALDRVGSQGGLGYEEDDSRWIAELINVFSRLVLDYCEREFLPLSNDLVADTARKFIYDGDGILSLRPYEARSISAVTMYTDLPIELRPYGSDLAEGYSSTVGSWYGDPRNKTTEGTFIELEIPSHRRHSRVTSIEVSVFAKWGAGVVPQVGTGYALGLRSMQILDAYRNHDYV